MREDSLVGSRVGLEEWTVVCCLSFTNIFMLLSYLKQLLSSVFYFSVLVPAYTS